MTQNMEKFSPVSLNSFLIFAATAGTSIASLALYDYLKTRNEQQEEANDQKESEKMLREEHENKFNGLLSLFDFQSPLRQSAISLKNEYHLPQGLPNIGNTCYMNSLIQCLAGSSTFVQYAKKLWNMLEGNQDIEDKHQMITLALLDLVINLSNASVETRPDALYSMLQDHEFTRYREEQDSHELLVFIQDNITKVSARQLRDTSEDDGLACQVIYSARSDREENAEQRHDERIIKGRAKIAELQLTKKIGINPFAGIQLSSITCHRCGPEEALYRWEVAYDLSLDLGPNIITSLNKYFKGEVIEDYTCIKCSLRDFLAKYPKDLTEIGDRDTRQALEFLTRLKGTHDLDEELFVKEWREFKETTKNSCKLQIDKLHTRITKKFSIVTPPKILCLHLKRVYYWCN
ncbi:hypothetical protein FGO68_gene11281 [Halteria grandinella]|uniref:USP domain-containing protein n=1 Tax=Halteria grandinella TaxID=5974 RepID=A0A8J8P513_HALGN|nr:hypothetical protein FGO68_gene11281 [Halteria grandinella]